ncbi:hypothetical protein Hanom_Chr12g01131141 [Helianthus anomalus]
MCVTCFTSVGRPISISISCSSTSSLNTIIIINMSKTISCRQYFIIIYEQITNIQYYNK